MNEQGGAAMSAGPKAGRERPPAGPGCERCDGLGRIPVIGRNRSVEETCPKCGPKPEPPARRREATRAQEHEACLVCASEGWGTCSCDAPPDDGTGRAIAEAAEATMDDAFARRLREAARARVAADDAYLAAARARPDGVRLPELRAQLDAACAAIHDERRRLKQSSWRRAEARAAAGAAGGEDEL